MRRTVEHPISVQYRTRCDADLLELSRQGNPEAFGTFVERHQGRTYSLVLALTGSEEDAGAALSDAFVSLYRSLADRAAEPPRKLLIRHAVRAAFVRIHARHAGPLELVRRNPSHGRTASGAA